MLKKEHLNELIKALEKGQKIQALEERVTDLEKTLEKNESETERKGIDGYKHTPEEIGTEFGINPKKLREFAESGYAPCRISEFGDIYFNRKEIKEWVKTNLFTQHNGETLPVKVFIHSDKKVVGPLPKELVNISNIYEFKQAEFPPAVYFLVKKDKVVYVGKSVYLPARIFQHQGIKDYDRVVYLPVPKSELDGIEKELIDKLNPPLNLTNKRKKHSN